MIEIHFFYINQLKSDINCIFSQFVRKKTKSMLANMVDYMQWNIYLKKTALKWIIKSLINLRILYNFGPLCTDTSVIVLHV